MTNVDNVVAVGASISQFADLVSELAGRPIETWPDGSCTVRLDEATAVVIDPLDNPDGAVGVDADIDSVRELSHRRAQSRRVYEFLVDRTDWPLRLESDDDPDGVIAVRL